MVGGIVETGFGALTSEIGIGEYLMADGVSRTLLAGAKIYALASSGRKSAEALPTNMAGTAGLALDYLTNSGGIFQTSLGTMNDFATLFATGGLPGALSDISEGVQEFNTAKGMFQAAFGAFGLRDVNNFYTENINKY
jgi:hypothetical protein